ncbi:unnamed protein product [Schistosoma curassoni]|uniref:TLC domain-containing protein n=1 Tax=Schistosoma curassoni TaxID=6186 RepID=A0A183JPB6_9TREM|nr:unnamed protein product [Schistosoma curassoni]
MDYHVVMLYVLFYEVGYGLIHFFVIKYLTLQLSVKRMLNLKKLLLV